jgi:hypothetical protein
VWRPEGSGKERVDDEEVRVRGKERRVRSLEEKLEETLEKKLEKKLEKNLERKLE